MSQELTQITLKPSSSKNKPTSSIIAIKSQRIKKSSISGITWPKGITTKGMLMTCTTIHQNTKHFWRINMTEILGMKTFLNWKSIICIFGNISLSWLKTPKMLASILKNKLNFIKNTRSLWRNKILSNLSCPLECGESTENHQTTSLHWKILFSLKLSSIPSFRDSSRGKSFILISKEITTIRTSLLFFMTMWSLLKIKMNFLILQDIGNTLISEEWDKSLKRCSEKILK